MKEINRTLHIICSLSTTITDEILSITRMSDSFTKVILNNGRYCVIDVNDTDDQDIIFY